MRCPPLSVSYSPAGSSWFPLALGAWLGGGGAVQGLGVVGLGSLGCCGRGLGIEALLFQGKPQSGARIWWQST